MPPKQKLFLAAALVAFTLLAGYLVLKPGASRRPPPAAPAGNGQLPEGHPAVDGLPAGHPDISQLPPGHPPISGPPRKARPLTQEEIDAFLKNQSRGGASHP